MKRFMAVLACLALPVAVQAQDFPALFDVSGVAADDVLNVRIGPSASTDLLGALSHDATRIEVIRAEGNWGLINIGETTGWASLRYLAPSAAQPSLAYPQSCFGTEPFWSLRNGDEMVFERMGEAVLRADPIDGGPASGSLGRFFALGTSEDTRLTAVISSEACSDGMSDREFGLSVDLLVENGGSRSLYSGCCSLR